MKKFIIKVTLLFCVFSLVHCTYGRAKYRFKIATLAPEGSVWMTTYNAMGKEILQKTDGAVKFKCYPGGIQGDEVTVIRKMRIGQLHGGGFTGTGLSLLAKDTIVFQIPLLFDTEEEIDYVFPKMFPFLEKKCAENGYKILGWNRLGFSYPFSSKKIEGIFSLRKAKPWLIRDDIVSETFFKVAKIPAVSIDISDVLTGLRSGLIDTVFAPPVAMISLQWFTGINYHLDVEVMYSVGAFFVTKKKWDKLPETMKNSVEKICRKHFHSLDQKVREQNLEALAVMKAKGTKTTFLTKKEKDKFQDLSQRVAKQLTGNAFSRESIIKLQSFLNEYKSRQKATLQ